MCFHVLLTVDDSLECLLTVRAHVRPVLSVCTKMSLQTAVGGKQRITDETLVVLVTDMCLHVRLEHTTRHKVLQTLVAMVRSLTF